MHGTSEMKTLRLSGDKPIKALLYLHLEGTRVVLFPVRLKEDSPWNALSVSTSFPRFLRKNLQILKIGKGRSKILGQLFSLFLIQGSLW
jgi:hypothetical protein